MIKIFSQFIRGRVNGSLERFHLFYLFIIFFFFCSFQTEWVTISTLKHLLSLNEQNTRCYTNVGEFDREKIIYLNTVSIVYIFTYITECTHSQIHANTHPYVHTYTHTYSTHIHQSIEMDKLLYPLPNYEQKKSIYFIQFFFWHNLPFCQCT